MEYRIRNRPVALDLPRLQSAVLALDPAALVDRDPLDGAVRVAATLEVDALVQVLTSAGMAAAAGQVMLVPSVCCGGCGG